MATNQPVAEQFREQSVSVTVFWKPGCPYCGYAKTFLDSEANRLNWLAVEYIDISTSDGTELFLATNRYFDLHPASVPLTIIGFTPIVGYDDDRTSGAYMMSVAERCRLEGCPPLAHLLAQSTAGDRGAAPRKQELPTRFNVPYLDAIDLTAYSLPALTILLAAIDGFNPCAMWVLVFLVGLLVGMQDRVRMWILGGVFLFTSGIVYFGFLTAWLNLFLVIGAVVWVRVLVGCVALGSGIYYMTDFFRNTAAECQVTNPRQRMRIMSALRASVNEPSFLLAIAGIIVLAAAVNLIEFLCSAGIPAVYTQVLANNDLPPVQYYALIGLYVAVFILDDAVIFVAAMLTLAATGMTTRYLRFSHLIGGLVMTGIGLMLIFVPGWLTFSA